MLSTIRTDTDTGADGLPTFLLKRIIARSIAANTTTIVKASSPHGVFQTVWKKANVFAVCKGKNAEVEASSYRPVFILPVLARLVDKELASQLIHVAL
jgi:hypothetical protein